MWNSFCLALLLLVILLTLVQPFNKKQHVMVTEGSVRIVIVSDTHRFYDRPIPNGDILIHAGDSEFTASEMDSWASKQPHSHKIAVCGNMDYALNDGKSNLQHVKYLQDSEIVISGLKIYGSPWTPKFTGVFQLDGHRQAEEVWGGLPSDVDILISHGPPKGILDRTSRGIRVGDAALLEKVEQIKPRVHCFGHIHESYGTLKTKNTIFCNAAVFNGHAAIVVDVPMDKSKPAVLIE